MGSRRAVLGERDGLGVLGAGGEAGGRPGADGAGEDRSRQPRPRSPRAGTRSRATPPRPPPAPKAGPKRYHGAVTLDATRAGRDASRIAEEVIAHLAGVVGAKVKVTLEIEAEIPGGAPENLVRTVTENGRALKFTSQGFEEE